jgi:hypothetical protein
MEVIWVAREAEYFVDEGWTAFTDLPVVPIGRMRQAAMCACASGKSVGSKRQPPPDIASLIPATLA